MSDRDMTVDIIYDESGELRSGVFFQFGVEDKDVLDWTDPDRDDAWIVSSLSPTNDELFLRGEAPWMWGEIVSGLDLYDEASVVGRCRLDCNHVTERRYTGPFLIDLCGGTRQPDFIRIPYDGAAVVEEHLAKRLKASGLKGIDLSPVEVNVNQTAGPDPTLFLLQFTGANCLRPRKVVGVPNACPFCGKDPYICPACGYEESLCSNCGNETRILASVHKGLGDKRLRMAAEPKAGTILDGTRWDGSDFFNCFGWTFVTRRAVDWLLSIHAAPFYARPVRVCVDGMTDEQLERLGRVKRTVAG